MRFSKPQKIALFKPSPRKEYSCAPSRGRKGAVLSGRIYGGSRADAAPNAPRERAGFIKAESYR